MSGVGGGGVGPPDPKNMSEEEKAAVLAMMKNEMDYKFGLLYRMSTTCWNKCIDRPKDGELSLGENACIDRCAAKFWQVATIIGNQMVAGAVQGGMQK